MNNIIENLRINRGLTSIESNRINIEVVAVHRFNLKYRILMIINKKQENHLIKKRLDTN